MTRSVTLADLAPSRVPTSAKGALEPAQQADASGQACCFADQLESAAVPAGKARARDDGTERRGEAGSDSLGASAMASLAPEPSRPLPAEAQGDKGSVVQPLATAPARGHRAALDHFSMSEASIDPQVSESRQGRKTPVGAPVSSAGSGADEVTQVQQNETTPFKPASDSDSRTGPAASSEASSPPPPDLVTDNSAAQPQRAVGPNRTIEATPDQKTSPSDAGATGRGTDRLRDGSPLSDARPAPPSSGAGSGAAGSGAATETVPVAFVSGTVGEFSAQFDKSVSDFGLSPTRSDFVASNGVLSAALSKPVSQGSGVYSVTAMLNPPSLGHVQAVVKVDGLNVNVAIVAHTQEGHHAIAGHLDELRQELATKGGDLQLSLSDGGSKGRQHDEAEPVNLADDTEGGDIVVLTTAPPEGGRSLHVIL
jgi:hypothetical protein